jgi:hypothetical protein
MQLLVLELLPTTDVWPVKTYFYILRQKNMFRIFLACVVITFSSLASASSSYVIEVSHNDEFFIINGEKFEAKTYCFNMEVGDRVIFISGSPFGACASAEVLNLRTRSVCSLWCE